MIEILSEEQEHNAEGLFKKERRVTKWERSGIVPNISEMIDDINHDILVL